MLRRKGHISTAYIDDSRLQGRTKQQCAQNVSDTVHLLDNLEFTVHDKKSVLIDIFQLHLALRFVHQRRLTFDFI